MTEHLDRCADLFAALADPTRRRILDLLAVRGEATATALADRIPVSRQAIARHLGVLDGAELVAAHRRGREVLYVVRPARIAAAAGWLTRVAAEWEVRLEAIKRIAEAGDGR